MKPVAYVYKLGVSRELYWGRDLSESMKRNSTPLYQVKELSDEQIVFARMLAGDNLRDFVNAIIEKATS